MAYADFIKRLNEEPWFQQFVDEVVMPDAPEIETFNPSQDNTEMWKYASAMREGYRLCLQKFGVRLK